MIKQYKYKCWYFACDKCGDEIERGMITHYKTKKEAMEFTDEYLDFWEGKKQVLCNRCQLGIKLEKGR